MASTVTVKSRDEALQAVLSKIDPYSTVREVLDGTLVADSIEYYKQNKTCPMPYGQSMTLLMMVES
ncbi:hypothetical protein J43TS9_14420 [Paenibacillus cineris]|nr:hypothetical protein J43TS9_14420 [Paenibacillus cineris]